MQLHQKIPLLDLDILNALISTYLDTPEKLAQLYAFKPNLEGIEAALLANEDFANRTLLHESLTKQYDHYHLSKATQTNLELLKDSNTFTVCAAHQLCLFTGPSYFIYKILSAIKLSQELKIKFPSKNFVPVYWMGSEDHDFEEINHAFVYGKKITWENTETG
ncbi:MAG: bacillithiol biosynthesis BshC, partial [Candidatus Paceibacterota bacterium]